MSEQWRDHDHTAEHAFITYLSDPTPETEHAAELAIARLQRRYDHVLRRLDGTGEPPPYPVHSHNADEDPASCLEAVLHELAGALLDDRAETLAHGLEAVRELQRRLDQALEDSVSAATMAARFLEANEGLQAELEEARRWARWAYSAAGEVGGFQMPAPTVPDWLPEGDGD